MSAKPFVVRGRSQLFSLEAIRRFRQDGVLVVRDYLTSTQLPQLTAACHAATKMRGDNVFPALDPEHRGGLSFGERMRPVSSGKVAEPPMASSLRKQAENSGPYEVNRGMKKVHLTARNNRAAERIYRRLRRARAKYYKLYNIPSFTSAAEESQGEMSSARLAEVQQQYGAMDVRGMQERYNESGKMELEIRRSYHINEAMEYLMNWPRSWYYLWPYVPELRQLLVPASQGHEASRRLGGELGEAVAALSGEVVVRLYDDSLLASMPFTNAAPFGFAASELNFQHPNGLSVCLGLQPGQPGATSLSFVIVPGSHSVVRAVTHNGKELDRFLSTAMFDNGHCMRVLPEAAHLPVVTVDLEPGMALFLNHFTLASILPSMVGCAASPYVAPMMQKSYRLTSYNVTLLPDRCAFDGKRTSWRSRDSHGMLYKYEPGQLLTDDALFPVLHRALDIE